MRFVSRAECRLENSQRIARIQTARGISFQLRHEDGDPSCISIRPFGRARLNDLISQFAGIRERLFGVSIFAKLREEEPFAYVYSRIR